MIAKPHIPEAEIRRKITAIADDLEAVQCRDSILLLAMERKSLLKKLDDWQAWRKQELRFRARHQRPSVRRHITRRVKTPI